MNQPIEREIRALRDRVFDHVCSDASWSAVKWHWMEQSEINWLKQHDFPLTVPHSEGYLREHG